MDIVARDLAAISDTSENDNATLTYSDGATCYTISHHRERTWLWHKCRVVATCMRDCLL